MNGKLLKPYDPKATEDRIYALWEESGFFNPDVCVEKGVTDKDADYFSIVLPPPNATGILHIGHSAMLAIEDIMVRFNRMKGKKTLWIPGTDHAAIATQAKVEKLLQKEKLSKHDLGREKFLERVEEFVEKNRGTILHQIRKMGSSVDWSREAFTLDEKRSLAVKTAFKQMYEEGLIYRGYRIVNWDPKGQTTVSDDEVEHIERKAKLYTFKYSKDFPIPIATTRPETKVGDTAVAVHPKDKRYKEYIDKEYDVLFAGVKLKIRIVGDEAVDPEFGTGAVGVTPAHSVADSEIAERHNLPMVQVINEYARMEVEAPELKGKKTIEAREIIVEWLKKEGLLEKEEEIDQSISVAERSGGTIEPLPKLQWFIDVNKRFKIKESRLKNIKAGQEVTLKELMLTVVRSGQIKIIPERFDKTYFHWIENLRDWNISRQIWYGHRVPVWYDKDNNVHLPKEQKIIFVRHGQSEANAQGIVAGHTDSPLTEQGRRDAHEIASDLKNRNITKIISSGLSRSKETAEIIGKELKLSVEIWDELHEIDAGTIEETPIDPQKSYLERAIEAKTGENLEQLEVRVKHAIKKLKVLDEDGEILIVGHNNFTALLFAVWNNVPKEKFIEYRRTWGVVGNVKSKTLTIITDPREENLTQDPDTLDTWFSSGLWTFSTLGWPQKTEDLTTYHPTTILETGYDILFFWVARMILMSTYLLGEIPFETVYLHGLIRDTQGRKMSKSLGNIIDPLDMIEKYGADATRLSLIIGTGPGNDSKLSEDKVRGYKHFSNKIWNITRFILSSTEDGREKKPELHQQDKRLLIELDSLTKEISSLIETYKFYLAGEKLYHYVWHRFADTIIEESKDIIHKGKEDEVLSRQWVLFHIWQTCLKLLHPFIPFITEEIWSLLPRKDKSLLLVEPWPIISS